MRPNTMLSGIFKTKRKSPVSTSMLTRMLVPNPKNAFQSPDVQTAGLKPAGADVAVPLVLIVMLPLLDYRCLRLHCLENRGRIGDPAEDATLGLDHFQAHLVEFGEVGSAAIRNDDAAIAAGIGLAHGGVDADLGGHAAPQQVFDAVFGQDVRELGGVERALAGLVDHDLAVEWIEIGDDV